MKTTILTFFAMTLLTCCSKDKELTQEEKGFVLPAITMTGANTFGVTIKGKVYIPRDKTGFGVGGDPVRGITFTGNPPDVWREIIVLDGASESGFKMYIHFKDLFAQGVGIYPLAQSNFYPDIDSIEADHIYFTFYDYDLHTYVSYGSIENQGEINISRLDGSSTTNWILSGTFKGKFSRYNHPTEIIEITDGRYDLNLNTLHQAVFP